MSEVEFVGHLIDNSGITFTPEKLKQVAELELPGTMGELKQFIGLASFFRRHVETLADLTVPLNEILVGYEKKNSKKKIEWTEEQKTQYESCKTAVVNCRKLYYEQDGLPIRVYTDASDYGIGAYLCQVKEDGTEVPIEFISKTLTKSEKKWSTYEKEAFAIFYALRKWEAHLRDVKFTLFTDHKNLTYLAKDPNAKVMRWRLAVQDYDFDIAYIPGECNIVADGFSRLCPKTLPEEDDFIDKAGSSINALRVNIDSFDQWTQVRDIAVEKEHVSYQVVSKEAKDFYDLSTTKAMCYAIATKAYKPKYTHIPRDKMDLIKECHNHHVGHWGINRTIELLKLKIDNDPKLEDLEWNCMRKDVQTFISRCDCCNKMSELQLTSHVQKYTTSEYGIMQCIAIDAIHMPKTKSGNKYILTVIDTFTRYTALYAIKDLTAETAAKTMINHMCVYGIPLKITSDNSTEYDAVFSEMLNILQTEKYRIHAYSHQENGIVERANKEVIRHARTIAYELRASDTWDENLKKVQAIMNEKVSEATGLTPNQIVFAGQIDLHSGRLYPQPTEKQRRSMSTYMKNQLDIQDQLMVIANEQQTNVNAARLANNSDSEIPHHIGEYIVVRHENGQPPTKLSVRWHGPYRILEVTHRPQGTVYTCYSPKTGKVADFHASLVQSHPAQTDMEAMTSAVLDDLDTFIIERIIGHQIVTDTTLNLNIKWHGYKEPEWTGLNISLKRNEAVQEYLATHNLVKYGLKVDPNDRNAREPAKKRVRFSSSVPEHD